MNVLGKLDCKSCTYAADCREGYMSAVTFQVLCYQQEPILEVSVSHKLFLLLRVTHKLQRS